MEVLLSDIETKPIIQYKLLTKEEVWENIERLIELHEKYGEDDSFSFTNRHKVFTVWVDDVIAAFAVLCQPHGYWWLRSCIVDKPYRGKGFQRLLIEQRLNYVRNKGGKRVCVSIDSKNSWSLNNAISCGFKFIHGGKNHNGHWYQKLAIDL